MSILKKENHGMKYMEKKKQIKKEKL